jgi:hypothetical protein
LITFVETHSAKVYCNGDSSILVGTATSTRVIVLRTCAQGGGTARYGTNWRFTETVEIFVGLVPMYKGSTKNFHCFVEAPGTSSTIQDVVIIPVLPGTTSRSTTIQY